jgi:hypothetical protein
MTNPSVKDDVRQPKLQSYCALLYESMVLESTKELVDGAELSVWRGYVTHKAKDVGIPDGVYKRVMDQLHRLKCVEQVERGYRGPRPTTVILLRPPLTEVWQDEIRARPLTSRERAAILDDRIKALEEKLKGVDIVQALAELQQQIDNINHVLYDSPNKER